MKLMLLLFAIFYLPFTKGSIITPQDMDRLILLDDILENLQHLGKQRAILNYVSVMHQRSCDSGQIWKHGRCQNIKTKRRYKFNPMRLVELIKKRYELNGKKIFYTYNLGISFKKSIIILFSYRSKGRINTRSRNRKICTEKN